MMACREKRLRPIVFMVCPENWPVVRYSPIEQKSHSIYSNRNIPQLMRVSLWRVCSTLSFMLCIYILHVTGVIYKLLETPYREFRWPLYVNLSYQVDKYLSTGMAEYPPLNDWSQTILINPRRTSLQLCHATDSLMQLEKVFVRVLIKSKTDHFDLRNTIRETWAIQNTLFDKSIEFIFFTGVSRIPLVNSRLKREAREYKDIVQLDVVEDYYNNTLKTMATLQWAADCPDFHFVLFCDDDFYVNVTNLRTYLQPLQSSHALFTGFRFETRPFRSILFKHYVSLSEYAFDAYPAFIAAGAYILSLHTAQRLAIASNYVYKYRFDDVYMGIIAQKLGVTPVHNPNFMFWTPWNIPHNGFPDAIAIHTDGDLQLIHRLYNSHRSKFM